MTIKIGINGFGRIGRMVLRAAWERDDFSFVQINDPGGDVATLAHLLNFDSVHGRWQHEAVAEKNTLIIDGKRIHVTHERSVSANDWSACDVVLESSGFMRSKELLTPFIEQGVKRVVVSAPLSDESIPNIVMGVNDSVFNPDTHSIVTAASCTTNCLAPLVKVVHEHFGIKHGSITTVHALTNDQSLLDAPHSDLRRARATANSLIPTKTGAATAIGTIIPELKGKLDGHAVRVPLTQGSLTDAVFELEKATSAAEVNAALKKASESHLKGILGFEEKPLVSVDFKTDSRSSIVDALSTLVVNGTHLKLYSWYDNEWGYANRAADVIQLVGKAV